MLWVRAAHEELDSDTLMMLLAPRMKSLSLTRSSSSTCHIERNGKCAGMNIQAMAVAAKSRVPNRREIE